MMNEEAEKGLNDYLFEGIISDIFWAEESYALAKKIGDYATQINAAGFGLLFGSLQAILSDRHTLSITKIFEERRRKYPIRSIPTTLDFLEEHSDVWTIPQPQELRGLLLKAGHSVSYVEGLDNARVQRGHEWH